MRFFGLSHAGKVREHNEDAWGLTRLQTGSSLAVVSDGVGGRAGGEVASRIVVETLPQLLEASLESNQDLAGLEAAVKNSLTRLSRSLLEQSRDMAGLKGLAATVVCALLSGESLVLGHMGDSRAYLFRENHLRKLTQDHTVTQMLLDQGEISGAEAATHPARGRLTQAVGMEQTPLPELASFPLQQGDRLLLCSDGLHGMVGDKIISCVLADGHETERACRGLIDAALEAGGRDNVTALIIDIEKETAIL